MTYRVRNILIAVALALVALLLTIFYVSHYKSNVRAKQETVPVLVAAKNIDPGTLGSQLVSAKLLTTQQIPRHNVAAGTVSNPDQIKNLIVTQPIYAGELVNEQRFGVVAQVGPRVALKGTYRAVELAGEAAQVLAGVVKAGDHVDVAANLKFPDEASQKHFSRIVLRNVLVLRADDSAPTGAVTSNQESSIMLRVTDDQLQTLLFVYKNSDWWIALRPALRDKDSKAGTEDAVSILRKGLLPDNSKQRLAGAP